MGEWVWTSYTIGGKIETAEQLAKLIEFSESFEEREQIDEMIESARAGQAICLGGQCNYGNAEDFDDFLMETGLTFHAHWAAASGVFDAGCRFWNPDMDTVGESTCDDNGDPTINLTELRRVATVAGTVETVPAVLEAASSDRVPALTLSPEALASLEASVATRLDRWHGDKPMMPQP